MKNPRLKLNEMVIWKHENLWPLLLHERLYICTLRGYLGVLINNDKHFLNLLAY